MTASFAVWLKLNSDMACMRALYLHAVSTCFWNLGCRNFNVPSVKDWVCEQVFELFYDFLVDSEAQQGASLYTLQGLMNSAANSSLLLHNGDVSYARCASC